MPFIGRSGETAFLPSSVNTSSSLTINGGDLNANNGQFFVDQSTTNVGIGVIDPDEKLVVADVAASSGFSQTSVRVLRSNYGGQIGGYIDQGVGHGLTFSTVNSGTASERVRIDSSGKLLVGTTTARTNYNNHNQSAEIQLEGINTAPSTISVIQNAGGHPHKLGGRLILGRSDGSDIGSNTIIPDDRTLGTISFQGNDGSEFCQAAMITAQTDATTLYDRMPGRLVFYTTASTGGAPPERMRIDSAGNVGIGTDSPQGILHVSSGTSGDATLILEADTDNSDETDNPNIVFRQDSGLDLGSIGMNFSNSSSIIPSNELYIAASSGGGSIVFATGTSNGYTNATERLRITSDGDVHARRNRSNTAGDVALSIQPGDSTIHYGFRIDIANNNLNLDRVGFGNLTTFRNDGLIYAKALQITDNLTATSGRGVEIFEAATGIGQISSYNRDPGGSWDTLRIKSSQLELFTSGSSTERLLIQSNGQILFKAASGDNQFTSRRTNVAGSAGDYFFHLNAQNRTPQTVGSLGFHQDGAEDSSRFVVATRISGGNLDERLRITSDGSVGIGTITPSGKLEVAGTIVQSSIEYPTIRPVLNLNFAATKTLDRRITFTRDGVGTYYDELGVLRYASNNVPRFDHDSTTGESLGLLIEESRTNKFVRSTTIGGTGWTQQGTAADYTTNTTEVAAPDGTFTALKWNPSAVPQYLYQNLTNIGTTQSTMSVWVRCPAGQSRTFFMNLYSPSQNSGAGSFTATDQWQRFTWTFTPQSQANVYPIVPDSTGIYYVWAPQLEEGAFATSYIPTSAGIAVTRGADLVTIKGTNFTSFHNATEGTLYGEYKSASGTAPYLVMLSDGTNNNRTIINANYDSYQAVVKYNNGTNQAVIDGGTPISNANNKTALAFKKDDFALSLNGGTVATDTSGDVSVNTMLTIGSRFGSDSFINSTVNAIKYYNKRLPNAQLQGLTHL
jgi:hypothetical protein